MKNICNAFNTDSIFTQMLITQYNEGQRPDKNIKKEQFIFT